MTVTRNYKVTFTHKLFPGQTGEITLTTECRGGDCRVSAEGHPTHNYNTSPEFSVRYFMSCQQAEVVTITELPPAPELVDLSKIAFTYSGRPGCACGCRGNYRYASAHRAWAEADQGHAIEDGDVSDRSVALTVKKINSLITAGEGTVMRDPAFVSVDTETRSYAAYFANYPF